jgi:hypothetical protein
MVKGLTSIKEIDKIPFPRSALETRMVFKIKEDKFGNPVRAKSRLVAKGFK